MTWFEPTLEKTLQTQRSAIYPTTPPGEIKKTLLELSTDRVGVKLNFGADILKRVRIVCLVHEYLSYGYKSFFY